MHQIFTELRHGQSHWRVRLNLPWFAYFLLALVVVITVRAVVDITDRYFEYAEFTQLRGLCDPGALRPSFARRRSSSSTAFLTGLAKALNYF